ncbi:hypothetical protein CRG98_003432 [Punica granatum]|nr:hypothetical protein CRG98_003432 [Punica granatum]
MYPWFAFGHLTSFLHLANKLALKGHRISFFSPSKSLLRLEPFNRHPDGIALIPVAVPNIHGLPVGSETTADVPFSLRPLIMTAMDLTRPFIEASLRSLKPDFVFFDFAHWVPALSRELGIKSIHYYTISAATVAYIMTREGIRDHERCLTEADLTEPPVGFPTSSIKLSAHEARELAAGSLREFGSGISLLERQVTSWKDSDAIAFKSCREIEGSYCDYLQLHFNKPLLLAGPVMPEPPNRDLKETWVQWLNSFEPRSVIFCALGSECILKTNEFQELVLGLEITNRPFLVALKPPAGATTVESALPSGFLDRVKDRAIVHGGWVEQNLILQHPSVGFFVTHCGSGSLSEAMISDCQMVLLPHAGDQFINARVIAGSLKVGVEVEKLEDGSFTRDGVCKAVRCVMDEDSEVGNEVRVNHMKWKEFLLRDGLEESYINEFVKRLHTLLE